MKRATEFLHENFDTRISFSLWALFFRMEIHERGSSRTVGLAESIQKELGEIITVPVNHSVLRVPEHIKRQYGSNRYEPLLISIGPVFHGQYQLKPMEAFKKRYAKNFIKRCDLKIQELIDITKEHEQMLRDAYGMKSSKISSHEFVKIMVIDGAFLIELLLRHFFRTFEEMDRMGHKKWNTFTCDILLLENQIPYSYLHKLLHLGLESKGSVSNCHCLDDLLNSFVYETVLPQFVAAQRCFDGWDAAHEPKHLLDFLTTRMQYKPFQRSRTKTSSSVSCPTISQLQRAGIKFRTSRWFDEAVIDFKRGILEIPRFTINKNTERYFANLLASELYKKEDRYASDYIALMNYLIDGPEDVKILVQNGILNDDDGAAAHLFNDIARISIEVNPNFLYSDLVEDLNAHCRKVWIKWKSTRLFEWKRDLKRNYCSNPWKTLSVIAAVLLLWLTVTQTVFFTPVESPTDSSASPI